MSNLEIVWTKVDEAPALATYSLLPSWRPSSARRRLGEAEGHFARRPHPRQFPRKLKADQKIGDEPTELGKLTAGPEANIIKLPNISASIPQLVGAIKELQAKGYDIPDHPDAPANDATKGDQGALRRKCSAPP